MSIRLNKAIRELNIGLQTAVEFLKKKSDLGEVRDDLSFKLNDAQYNALVEEFKTDKEARNQAEKLFPKHPKEKKRPEGGAKPSAPAKPAATQKYTVLGKIDLDNIGKKPSQAAAQPQQGGKPSDEAKPVETETAVAGASKHDAQPVAEHQAKAVSAPVARPEQAEAAAPVEKPAASTQPVEANPTAGKPVEGQREQAGTAATTDEESKIFTLKSEKKLAPKGNVLGKIDLDALNQSTRPKKK